MKGYAALFFGAILIAVFVLKEYSAGVNLFFTITPWWMYFVLCGIIYSGYKIVTNVQDEKLRMEKAIEEEGKVFMDRIEKAKAFVLESEQAADESSTYVDAASPEEKVDAEDHWPPDQKASGQ